MSHTRRATVKIINKLGLHARPAMALVDTANRFKADVTIHRDGSTEIVDGKSIMQVMMLAATCGTSLHLEATGPDADDALAAIAHLVKSKFEED